MNDLPLLGPAEIRELAEMLGIRPTKTLGQNFVIDPIRFVVLSTRQRFHRRRRCWRSARLGSLTLGILDAAKDMVAVEIDPPLLGNSRTRLRSSAPRRWTILTWCLWTL